MEYRIDDFVNKITCGDCMDFLPNLPRDSVDVVITSPPYNVASCMGRQENIMYQAYDDDITQKEYLALLEKWLDAMLRVAKRYVFLNLQPVTNNKWAVFHLIASNNYLKQIIVWNKGAQAAPALTTSCLTNNYEFILVYDKIQPARMGYHELDFGIKGEHITCWTGPANHDFHCDENHAIFPLWLPRKIMELFTKENDIILDPFMGVGTTALVAKQINRRFIGFEIDQKQIDIAYNRLSQETLWQFKTEDKNGQTA